MKIAILASEGAPYAKSGGLGDVMEALPAALSRIEGNEVVLILPYYKKIKENAKYEVEQVAEFEVGLGWRNLYCGVMKLTNRADKVSVYFIDTTTTSVPVPAPSTATTTTTSVTPTSPRPAWIPWLSWASSPMSSSATTGRPLWCPPT